MARKRYSKKRPRRKEHMLTTCAKAGASRIAEYGTQLAIKGLRQISYLKGLVNSEVLKSETTISTTAGTTAVVTHLTGVAQGDTVSGRTGNSIYVRKCIARFLFEWQALTPTGVRLMLVLDKQQVGDTSPSVTDILTTATLNSWLNPATVGRFSILYNKRFVLDTNKPMWVFDIIRNMRHHVRYNGTASTDIQRGGLYLIAFSTDNTNPPSYQCNARIEYHDN